MWRWNARAKARGSFSHMLVKDILEVKGSDVFGVEPTTSVEALATALQEQGFGAAVVVDNGELVGIISERDIVRLAAGGGAMNSPVSAVMTTKVEVCSPDEDISNLAEVMTNKRFRHFPVMEDGVLVGLVSIGDVVKARLDALEAERAHLSDYVQS